MGTLTALSGTWQVFRCAWLPKTVATFRPVYPAKRRFELSWMAAGGASPWPGGARKGPVLTARQAGRSPIRSPRRTVRSGTQSDVNLIRSRSNSITTVDPSRNRPISSPLASMMSRSA